MARSGWGVVLIAACIGCGNTRAGPSHAADAGAADSNADPCAMQGCGPTPQCGTACSSSCGCCACPGTESHCQNDLVLRCDDPHCYSVVDTCPSADACVDVPGFEEGAFCARATADCSKLAGAYQAAVAAANLTPVPAGSSGLAPGAYNFGCAPADCGIVAGHCDLGLGACWYLGRPQPDLEHIASLYMSLGCAKSTACSCPPANVDASCETNPDGGSWMESSGAYATYACVVP